MSKLKRALLILIPLLVITLFGAVYSVLHTQAGANWLVSNLQGRLDNALQVGAIEGDLRSGLTLSALVYRDDELAVRAEQVQLALNLELFPPLVRIESLKIETLVIEQLKSSPEPVSLDETLAALNLPVAIELTDLLVENVTFTGPDGVQVFSADRLGGRLALDDTLRIERFFSESDVETITLAGELGLVSPYALHSMAELRIQWPDQSQALPPYFIRAAIDGSLAQELGLDITSENPSIRVAGTLVDPAGNPQWRLTIESSALQWPPGQAAEADVSIADLIVTTEGWFDAYQLAAEGGFKTPDVEMLTFNFEGKGRPEGVDVSSLAVSGKGLELSATGSLSWQDAFSLELLTTIQRLEPENWVEQWPEGRAVSGQVNLAVTESNLDFSGLEIEVDGSPFRLDGSGRADFSDGAIAADLGWHDFGWPPGSDAFDLESPQGTISLSGVLDDWTARLDAALEAPGLPGGNVQVEATGNREQAAMTIVEGRVLGGVISGDAELNWTGNGQWAANLSSSGIELGRIFPDWPARINTVFSARGQAEPLAFHVDIRQLDGQFKSIPLAARGGIDYRDGLPSFDGFHLELGQSTAELNGQILSGPGLTFSILVDELASLDARGSGRLEASGRLSLDPETPHLALDLEGSELSWNDFRAQSISIHDTGQSAENSLADLDLLANNVTLSQQHLDTAKLTLRAGRLDQDLAFEVEQDDITIAGGLSGAFRENGETFFSSGWQGQLTSLAVSVRNRLKLSLQNPALLAWSPSSATLGNACLEAGEDASLCVEGEWEDGHHASALFRSNRVPLNLLRTFLETDLEFTQTIDGELNWASTNGVPASGNAVFRISPGELRYPDDFDSLLKTGDGLLTFNLDQGRLSEGKLRIPLPGMGEVDVDLSIPDVTSGLDAEIDGHVNIRVADMDVITLFYPEIDQAGGRFSAELDLAGTVGQPQFSGQLSLADGLVRHNASGLRLNNINLAGRVLNNDQSTLEGSFKALEGTGEINGRLDITDILSPRLELKLTGQNLKLFDAPDLTLVAEPDLQLAWQPGLIEIAGSILIPSAQIVPDFIPSSTVSESPDLQIVAGKPPDTKTPEEEETRVSIRGNLEVTLGKDVNLELDHATARLAGTVKFTWQDDLVPMANGQYSLVGQINALGQRLEITQGTIGFPDVPADNPHLNIQAEREIFGNSEIRSAGVFVTGTLRRFTMEPYTEPMTNRERARTLLITGSDFNMEEGVGAVDIGFYVAPRIFLSYGIGVFDDDNVVSVRYDLGRGWGVKATSGQDQTGLDLSYTIER